MIPLYEEESFRKGIPPSTVFLLATPGFAQLRIMFFFPADNVSAKKELVVLFLSAKDNRFR